MINKLKEAVGKFYRTEFSVDEVVYDGSLCYKFIFDDNTSFYLRSDKVTENNFDEILFDIKIFNSVKLMNRALEQFEQNEPRNHQERFLRDYEMAQLFPGYKSAREKVEKYEHKEPVQ